MKTLKTLSCALAVALVLVGANAMGHDLTVNISGTVKYQDLYGDTKGTVTTKSFTEKQVY